MKLKPWAVKLSLYTSNLAKTQAFYTILGISWDIEIETGDLEIGKSGLPKMEEEGRHIEGFPHLSGTLANTDFRFFFRADIQAQPREDETVIMIDYDGTDDIRQIADQLTAQKLFVAGDFFDARFGGTIFDPDGRTISICGPMYLR